MLKIFTTQLTGLMTRFYEKNEMLIEDSARLLSQALVGEGNMYVYGFREMEAVTIEAVHGYDRHERIKPLLENGKIADVHIADRVLLVTHSSADSETLAMAKTLNERNIPFIIITANDDRGTIFEELADLHLNLNARLGLIPTDSGERIGYPGTILALYAYSCIRSVIQEMIDEY